MNTIIIGSLNTDLIINGAQKLLKKGEATLADSFVIAPGGKSRNIAIMLATLRKSGKDISFVGKTLKDKYGFWKSPIDSLKQLKIDTSQIKIIENHKKHTFPGLAIIPIDKQGNNQIYLVPGIRNEFSPSDVQESEKLFEKVSQNNGSLGITLEMRPETALKAMKLAKKYKLRTFVDPGGIEGRPDLINAIKVGGFLIKPNEHEAKAMTGIKVTNFSSAKRASKIILTLGYEYVIITHGKNGAYLYGKQLSEHIKIPDIDTSQGTSVGCGDQTMAAIMYSLSTNPDIRLAMKHGVIAGTLQHTKKGIEAIESQEILKYI